MTTDEEREHRTDRLAGVAYDAAAKAAGAPFRWAKIDLHDPTTAVLWREAVQRLSSGDFRFFVGSAAKSAGLGAILMTLAEDDVNEDPRNWEDNPNAPGGTGGF